MYKLNTYLKVCQSSHGSIVIRTVCDGTKPHQILFQEIQFNNNFTRQLIIHDIIENFDSVNDYAGKLFNHSLALIGCSKR
jgi:hypothetical protein